MKPFNSLLFAALPTLCIAQNAGTAYTDKASGIVFSSWSLGDVTFGAALPANALTTDATELIGLLTCATPGGQGWCGISFGGSMTNSLLLLAYPNQGKVLTSFRWATDYVAPVAYTGNAQLTQVSSTVNSTHFSVIFRCQNCLKWSQGGKTGSASTSQGSLVLGWAHATTSPSNAACPNSAVVKRHDSQNVFGAPLNAAVNSSYSAWAAKATAVVAGSCSGGGGGPSTLTTTTKATTTAKPTTKATTTTKTTTTARPPTPTYTRPPF